MGDDVASLGHGPCQLGSGPGNGQAGCKYQSGQQVTTPHAQGP